jgi:cell division protein FtsZ
VTDREPSFPEAAMIDDDAEWDPALEEGWGPDEASEGSPDDAREASHADLTPPAPDADDPDGEPDWEAEREASVAAFLVTEPDAEPSESAAPIPDPIRDPIPDPMPEPISAPIPRSGEPSDENGAVEGIEPGGDAGPESGPPTARPTPTAPPTGTPSATQGAKGRTTKMLGDPQNYLAVIKVVGVGGGGGNAINRMIDAGLKGVEFIAVNTDAQSLLISDADVKLDIGRQITRGLGAGSDPEIGRQAADDHRDEIEEVIKGADMVFITAGEGGGTGTGGAPIVAEVSRALGALTIGIVTRPFSFEGRRRGVQADGGIQRLREKVDTLIVVPNDRLLEVADEKSSLLTAFKMADDVLLQGVQGIADLITTPGLINTDFADVRMIMQDAGTALMGIGSASGEGRALAAARHAISSVLLEASIEGARGLLLNVAGPSDLGLFEVNEAAEVVKETAHPDANIIFGATIDDSLGDEVRITVIAAGFDRSSGDGPSMSRRAEPSLGLRDDSSLSPFDDDGDSGDNGDDFDVPEFLR